MRKLDNLIIKAFVGPFILTTLVATFVLLIQYMLKYFDDFVGKNLGFGIFAELIFYFSLNMLQVALPLGILVSSLMTFGNLGENFELTAIKSSGISLLRALRPIFFFVILLSIAAFFFNNHIVPTANLQAYSLLYDIKHKKPALDIKEGVFYNGIPDYSIKVKEKYSDNQTLKDVLIYDHTDRKGNNRVIIADSSKMYMIYNERYLKLELYDGNYVSEEDQARNPVSQFYRTKFDRMDMVFNLSSFDLARTKTELFQNNRQMKNVTELSTDIDSLRGSSKKAKNGFIINAKGFFSFHLDSLNVEKYIRENRPEIFDESEGGSAQAIYQQSEEEYPEVDEQEEVDEPDDLERLPSDQLVNIQKASQFSIRKAGDTLSLTDLKMAPQHASLDTLSWGFLGGALSGKNKEIAQMAKSQAQNVKTNLSIVISRVDGLERNTRKWIIEKHKKYSQAFACIVMFLIGAPLGAIIKRGGLGVPVIVSILFFLVYYIVNIICEKSAREGIMDPAFSVWVADLVLLPIGFFFLRQARIDARLFDTDFYLVWWDKLKNKFFSKRKAAMA